MQGAPPNTWKSKQNSSGYTISDKEDFKTILEEIKSLYINKGNNSSWSLTIVKKCVTNIGRYSV